MRIANIIATALLLLAAPAPALAHRVPAPAGQLFISTISHFGDRESLLPNYYVFSSAPIDRTRPCQPKIARIHEKPRADQRGAYATVEPATLTFNPAGQEVYHLARKNDKWSVTNSNGVLVGTCYPMARRILAQCVSREEKHEHYLGSIDWSCMLIIPMKI